MTQLINAPLTLSYRLPVGYEPLNRLVSEILMRDRHEGLHRHVNWQ